MMSVLDWTLLLIGAILIRFTAFLMINVVIAILAVILLLHLLLGERYPKFGQKVS